jgi:phage-related protein (TIGR01555 family)
MAKTVLQRAFDGFKNVVAELGTSRDKQSAGEYVLTAFSDLDWDTIYRVSWMGRKIVDIPAEDATRRWREWQGDADQAREVKKEEARLHVPNKVQHGMKQGRCYGGAGIYIAIRNSDPELELFPDQVGQGDLEYLVNLTKDVLEAGPIDYDPISPTYGMPLYYELRSSGDRGITRVHPSRLVLFQGNELLNPEFTSGAFEGWGESVLMSAYQAVRDADATASNISSLVYEAKVDILQLPNLADIMSNKVQRDLLVQRVQLAGQLKGNNGMLVLDTEEEYNHRSFNFAGLPEINRQALQAVAGAADIPITRFLGQTPSGLSSTGESDLKNYYDSVSSMQELLLTPALTTLDRCIVRSALGDEPEDLEYQWASLWQTTDLERAEITEKTTNSIKTLADTGLFPPDALSEAARSVLMEHSAFPEIDYDPEAFAEEVAEAEAEAAAAAVAALAAPPVDPEEENDEQDAD